MQPQSLKFFQLVNPFYLLSALCMFAGCYGLLHSLTMAPGLTGTLLVLMSVVQVYELLLVGLAWYLIKSRRAERDGRMLLLLELPFLVDATYLSSEYSVADPHGGMLVGLLTLFLIKRGLCKVKRRPPAMTADAVDRLPLPSPQYGEERARVVA